MLDDIKLLLGITSTDKDSLLKLLINLATEDAKSLTNRDDIDDMESVVEQMVIFKYNRIGTEGLSSESYSGVNYSYTDDYPDYLLRQLKKYRKLIAI